MPIQVAGPPQWLSDYHPCGKFSRERGFNVPGRLAWFLMESVGPIHLVCLLQMLSPQGAMAELPTWNKVAAALYVLHYANRAVIGPLLSAPSMSPVGVELFAIVCFHNWYNTAMLAPWIAGYEPQLAGFPSLTNTAESTIARLLPWVGLAIFALGMTNNIRAERRFWRMRRREAQRRAQATSDQGQRGNMYAKVYVIPPADGLFRHSLCPHYFWEWVEWFGYVLVGTAVHAPTTASRVMTPEISLPPWLFPVARLAQYAGVSLPLAPLAYVIIFVTVMLPQAKQARRWYQQKFGERAVAGRSAVVPGVPWL